MSILECPCKGCTLRSSGCHSHCPKEYSYTDWKNDYDKAKELIKIQKEREDLMFNTKEIERYKRRQARKGRRI